MLFAGAGVKSLIVWTAAKSKDDFSGTDDYYTNYSAGLALGALCICLSLTYAMDFGISWTASNGYARANRRDERNYNY